MKAIRRPPLLFQVLAGLAGLATVAGCGGGDDSRPGSGPGSGGADSGAVDPSIFNCPEIPTAYVFDNVDPWTGVQGAADLLAQAGFVVEPLPLDADPVTLRGLIFFSSFASESEAYRTYVKNNATALYTFVDAANVVVQMTQADQTEAMTPFLPSAYLARRSDLDLSRLKVLDAEHPLLKDIPVTDGFLAWQAPNVGWETFISHGGFQTVLAENETGANAALLEGAYGQGRFILTGMAFDKPLGGAATPVPFAAPIGAPEDRDAFNKPFFANLFQHVKNVCRRQTRAIMIGDPNRPSFAPDSFVLAVLPDTQYYSLLFPGIYSAQTSWIVSNAKARRIPYVLHLGDIVNNNSPAEWAHAHESMALLHGVVPYALATGNHDYGPSGDATTRDTLMNDYFSYQTHAAMPTFGGAFETGKLDNSYHLFSAGGRDFVVLALEWGPRNAVIDWANTIMARYPERDGVLITHAYLNNNDRRYDWTDKAHPQDFDPHAYGTAGGVNDGEELWQKLVRRHRFIMTINGHVLGDGTGYLASVTDVGNTCHQILANYQFRNLGGEGFMRLLEFLGDGKTVRVHSYSPLYDSYLTEADQKFTFTLDVPPRRAP